MQFAGTSKMEAGWRLILTGADDHYTWDSHLGAWMGGYVNIV